MTIETSENKLSPITQDVNLKGNILRTWIHQCNDCIYAIRNDDYNQHYRLMQTFWISIRFAFLEPENGWANLSAYCLLLPHIRNSFGYVKSMLLAEMISFIGKHVARCRQCASAGELEAATWCDERVRYHSLGGGELLSRQISWNRV